MAASSLAEVSRPASSTRATSASATAVVKISSSSRVTDSVSAAPLSRPACFTSVLTSWVRFWDKDFRSAPARLTCASRNASPTSATWSTSESASRASWLASQADVVGLASLSIAAATFGSPAVFAAFASSLRLGVKSSREPA